MTGSVQGQYATSEAPPFSFNLSISSSTISLSGNPLFYATSTYTCTTTQPIYALIHLYTQTANNLVVRDPNYARKRNARIGPSPTIGCLDREDDPPKGEDAILLYLKPGGKFESIYTFATTPKSGGWHRADTHSMREGGTYTIESRAREFWWMYAEDVDEGLSEEEKKAILTQRKCMSWKPDCKLEFTAIA
jgi:hypothetical protein